MPTREIKVSDVCFALTSSVTVLSSDDPIRVIQDFNTIDLLSNGDPWLTFPDDMRKLLH